jgi:hypothetical protein
VSGEGVVGGVREFFIGVGSFLEPLESVGSSRLSHENAAEKIS